MSRIDDDNLYGRLPGDNIACKDCDKRLREVQGYEQLQRYKYGFCGAYDNKPHGVLWENAKCPEYEKEV